MHGENLKLTGVFMKIKHAFRTINAFSNKI